jgi:DNA topoisomerase-1
VVKRDKEGVKREYRVFVLRSDKVTLVMESENTGAEKSKLFPTDLGLVVTDFLKQYFDDIMDYGFTARIEEEFDEVAEGKIKWNKMIDEFYLPFKKDVDKTIETAERAHGERELGLDPETGKKVVARMGRYGPMIQIGEADENEKPRFAKIPNGQSIETISFEEAMKLFSLQGVLGQYEEKDVSTGVGPYGPYVKWGDEYVSVPRGTDLQQVDFAKAVHFIKLKQIADAPISTYDNKPVTKGKGRFGPYIKWDGMFINVPKRYDHDNLSAADIKELVEAKIKKEANRYIHNWPEEKISVENARWGPIIKLKKKPLKLPRKADDTKYTADDLKTMSLDDVKNLILTIDPNAFGKRKAAAKKADTPKKKEPVKKKAAKKK